MEELLIIVVVEAALNGAGACLPAAWSVQPTWAAPGGSSFASGGMGLSQEGRSRRWRSAGTSTQVSLQSSNEGFGWSAAQSA
ncbi:hypothetical protein U9M48_005579 [Paspalum notatum var. saurae]|uniref:Secreted protein n=1 Tax=Paspalum notatum var. saurae TaxID=547442 RepID=A0AAQ3PQH9_PASNO